ncbi:hypothetical protein DC20_02255 [Rufibacter tibetensis]|uniref:YaiO beta-barrel domain-containing protein n=1 Tax=Rufibacter tibetensis TaxID=512763 RepID=A0A0P0CG54_9BACT|nr:hypothetical protein DC20_02255 [Rufibacter tibetensis]
MSFALFFILLPKSPAQSLSPDKYFEQARKVAFEQKDYPAAIHLCRQALKQSPEYIDISIFLGRLYYWNKQTDSSLVVLKAALQKKPEYEDATLALADVSFFEKNYSQALAYSSQGLKYNSKSNELSVRKVRSLAALSRSKEAYVLADSLLQVNSGSDQLRSLVGQLREFSFVNKLGMSYDYTYFDRQFSSPWHLATLDYSRQTKHGTFTGRVSYSQRYGNNGVQVEAEAYPRISKTFYAYVNVGGSPDLPVFPKSRAGFSLYANLPKAWEAEGGIRYLNFGSSTFIYTASIGKYLHNLWFNARTYVSPGSNAITQSYSFTTRYYLKGAEDYISISLGRGVSPDDRMQANRLNSSYRLETYRMGAGYRYAWNQRHIFSLAATYEKGEYMPETKGSQWNGSVGYQLRF